MPKQLLSVSVDESLVNTITELQTQKAMLEVHIAVLETKIKESLIDYDRLEDRLEECTEHPLPGTPHSDPQECPMWYDYCHCTVESLEFNIRRADKAEARIVQLREACKPFYLTEWPHRVHLYVDDQDQELAERFSTAMRDIYVAMESMIEKDTKSY